MNLIPTNKSLEYYRLSKKQSVEIKLRILGLMSQSSSEVILFSNVLILSNRIIWNYWKKAKTKAPTHISLNSSNGGNIVGNKD